MQAEGSRKLKKSAPLETGHLQWESQIDGSKVLSIVCDNSDDKEPAQAALGAGMGN